MMREGRFFYGPSDEEFLFYQKKIRLTTDETRLRHLVVSDDIHKKISTARFR